VSAGANGEIKLGPSDRRRLQLARDYLIDAENELGYVADRDPSLEPVVGQLVNTLMEISRKAESIH
jgi:hypothetical protein